MTMADRRAGEHEIAEAEASRIDMQVFDRLPESYRNLIRYAQIEVPATVARAYLAAFGQRLGLLLLRWALAARSRKIDERQGSARRALSRGTPQPCPFPAPPARSRHR